MGWTKKGNLKGPKGDAGSIDWGEDVTIDAKKNVTLRFDAATSSLRLAGDDKAYDSQALVIDKSGFVISSGGTNIVARKDGDISISAGNAGPGTLHNAVFMGDVGVRITQTALVGDAVERTSLSMIAGALKASFNEVAIRGKSVRLEGRGQSGAKSLVAVGDESVSVESKNGLFVNGGRVFTGPRKLWEGRVENYDLAGVVAIVFEDYSAFVLRVATSDGFVVPIEVRMADDGTMNARTYSGSTTVEFLGSDGYKKRATFSFGLIIDKTTKAVVGGGNMLHVDDAAGRFDDNNIFLVSAEGLW